MRKNTSNSSHVAILKITLFFNRRLVLNFQILFEINSNKYFLFFRYKAETKFGAFFTSGNVEWHDDKLYCQSFSEISILDIDTGNILHKIGEENSEDADTIQTFTSDGELIATSHRSGLLKLWNSNGELIKMWKYIHKGPISRLILNNKKLFSGGSDGTLRVWDLTHHTCVMSLKNCTGVISVIECNNVHNMLFASGDDNNIFSWDMTSGKLKSAYNGHFSKVTSISFHVDNEHFVSSGRDKVLILWNIEKSIALKTVPLYEAIETVICLPLKVKLPDLKLDKGIHVAAAGELGKIRIWDMEKPKEVYTQTNSLITKANEEGGLAVLKLLFNKERKQFALVSADQNIIVHDTKSFICKKQFVGFSDEILDLSFFGENDSYIAVATNSNDIKLYDSDSMNCRLLKGHTDLVLALNKSITNANLLVSASKDNTIRLWLLTDSCEINCVGIGRRHTASVTSVVFSQTVTKFIASVSQDNCIKLWTIPEKFEKDFNLSCSQTEVAHQKDINCVAVAPNDRIIATASQDKTTKLWTQTLQEIGVLRGHRRGVWCVRFSPVDQVVMTSSADCTIKLWSITDLRCLKTIEGHESSVTRIEFISKGMQIMSAGADGLIKLFNLKTSECINTYEEHNARVWSLTFNANESSFVSGGTDSQLIKWKDVTEELQLERLKEEEEITLEEQKLNNYLHNDELLKALQLALRLDRPLQVLKIVQGVMKKGDVGLANTINGLRDDQKESLLKCATTWNTNSKHCQPAQLIINILLNELQKGQFKTNNLRNFLEGTLPYTERHFNRLTQLMQDVHFLNYTINCMKLEAKDETYVYFFCKLILFAKRNNVVFVVGIKANLSKKYFVTIKRRD